MSLRSLAAELLPAALQGLQRAPLVPARGAGARRGAVLRRAGRPAGLPVQGRPQAGARGLQVRRPGPPGPVPRQRPALHHAPDRGGGPVRRLEARRPGHHGLADARHDRGLRRHQARADREVRRRHRRPGGRPDQARQAALQHARGEPGRELPQDAAGDGARRARHPHQARRPPAQHAHDAGHGARAAPAHRARDAGHLRPHRAPAGPEPDLPRTAGAVLRVALPVAPRGAGQGRASARAATGATSSSACRRTSRRPSRQQKIKVQVSGREKTIYSIYRKMREKHAGFAQVSDIFGFRIVVPTLTECYVALGVLHQLYKPVPGRFKDYIAIPKANGYQSLHTTLVSPLGTAVEFQVRTEAMHAVAEKGIAAHWLYKTGGKGDPSGKAPRPTRSASRRCGCRACSTSRTRPTTRPSSWSTSRSTSTPTRSTSSRRAARSWRCRAAPRRWTSPTRSTPTSASTWWRPRSTASRWRCAPS